MIIHADCLAAMAEMEAESVDSIVTDPPYGLEFMGKGWDYGVPGVPFWVEALRVCKPGGHMLAFGGTRTYHRLVCAIEDAGWEIRDTIMWVYGSGFPKSLDVSKAIDKAAGAEREVVGFDPRSKGIKPGSNNYGGSGAEYEAGHDITAPSTDAAKRWSGWGTALKPACEPICVARKPLIGTVAANVLKYGTGAINVDGCRVETTDGYAENAVTQGVNTARTSYDPRRERRTFVPGSGRFPANFCHDGSDEVVGLFPESNGRVGMTKHGSGTNAVFGKYTRTEASTRKDGQADSGSAARFFYTAKASNADRGHVKAPALPLLGDEAFEKRNNHPTVKPTKLMRYLVRLVTPPGGTVLDPFMGSGTTLVAAKQEGFNAIGIEQDAESCATATDRVGRAKGLTRRGAGT